MLVFHGQCASYTESILITPLSSLFNAFGNAAVKIWENIAKRQIRGMIYGEKVAFHAYCLVEKRASQNRDVFNLFFTTTFPMNRNYSTDLSGARNGNGRLPAGWISFACAGDACNSEYGSMHHLHRFLFAEKTKGSGKKSFHFPIEQHSLWLSH